MNNTLPDTTSIISKLNHSKPTHETIYIILKATPTSSPIYEKLINVITDYHKMTYLDHDVICDMILIDIYNNYTDLILRFPNDKTIQCLQSLLTVKIPFFSLMFKDCVGETNNIIESQEDYDIMAQLIKFIYFPIEENISIQNYLELFELMDKYLMQNSFMLMLHFAEKNILNIVDYHLNKNNFNKLNRLKTILKNIFSEEPNKKDEFYYKNCKYNRRKALDILQRMCTILGTKQFDIFLFGDWRELFSYDHQFNAIVESKDYSLFNTTNISIKQVVVFLAQMDMTSNIYYEIINKINNKENISFKPNEDKYYTLRERVITVITQYYPIFTYHKFNKMPIKIINKLDNLITIKFVSNFNIQILINTQLFFGETIPKTHKEESYYVNKITKCLDDRKCTIEQAEYVPDIIGDITYELIMDKNVPEYLSEYTIVWNVITNTHEIL